MNHYKLNYSYVGVDTHKEFHVAVVINFFNEKLGEVKFDNKPATFGAMLGKVKKLSGELTPVFALEDVGGYGRSLAVYLTEKKETVKAVNPALANDRRKSTPTYKKDDSFDALTVAKVLKEDFDELPTANPTDIYWALAQLVGRRDSLVKNTVIIQNQLHDMLKHHYPSYRKFFTEIDSQTALAFWEEYPAPHCLEGVTLEQFTVFLNKASHNICSTKKAQAILELVAADGNTQREYQATRDTIVKSIVKQIKFNKQEIADTEKEMVAILAEMGYKLESMPGISTVTAANLIAEIGDIKRFPNADKLARFASIAPVKYSSAGKGNDQKAKQGNRTLHGIFYFLAVQQVQTHPKTKKPRNQAFYDYYQKKQKEGKSKPQALTCVMRRLCTIIYSMMKYKTEYVMPVIPNEEAV